MVNKIKRQIEVRNITSLYHFTTIDNLDDIFDLGLWSRQKLDKNGLDYTYSDEYRMDGRLNRISTSISFPNCKMLYWKQKDTLKKWCIIELDPKVLFQEDCLFIPCNAATTFAKRAEATSFRGADAFERMFLDMEPNSPYTNDVQAEVMINEFIDISYIKSVSVERASDLKFVPNKGKVSIPNDVRFCSNKSLFGYHPNMKTNYSKGA